MPLFAGREFTLDEIKGTIKLLDYYRRFLKSECVKCHNPESRHGNLLTKDQARQRLRFLVNVAINRKACIPDVACRKQESSYQMDLWRDCQEVRMHFNAIGRPRIWGLNGKRFRTDEIQKRYGHLLRDNE